jgi:Prokaryotic membrane lipoprotein lipid attachment site
MRRFIVAALLVAALAGCSGAAGSQAATTTTTPDVHAIWREVVQCLRDNGMPNLPDPRIDAQGQPHFPGGDPGDAPPQAERACMPIFNRLPASVREDGTPEGGEASRPPADIPALLRFARCMREQGMPDWPDPKADGTFPLVGTSLVREGKSPRFLKAVRACRRFNPDPKGGIHGS